MVDKSVKDEAERIAKEATRQAMLDPLMPYYITVASFIEAALLHVRSQAFEEAIRIAEEYAGQASAAQKAAFDSGRDDAGNMFWTGQTAALTISQAIRQHSQKGGANEAQGLL